MRANQQSELRHEFSLRAYLRSLACLLMVAGVISSLWPTYAWAKSTVCSPRRIGRFGIRVPTLPPPARIETHSQRQGDDVWQDGYWDWDYRPGGMRWVWVGGCWVHPDSSTVLHRPLYLPADRGFFYVSGYWGPAHLTSGEMHPARMVRLQRIGRPAPPALPSGVLRLTAIQSWWTRCGENAHPTNGDNGGVVCDCDDGYANINESGPPGENDCVRALPDEPPTPGGNGQTNGGPEPGFRGCLDLAIVDFQSAPTATVGQVFSVQLKFQNIGSLDLVGKTVVTGLYLMSLGANPDNPPPPQLVATSEWSGQLRPRETTPNLNFRRLNSTAPGPVVPGSLTPGHYILWARVDMTTKLSECDKQNNDAYRPLDVLPVLQGPAPDTTSRK
jgi:hypothetical protein